jgi:tetratricopeptide (TPR) repeat protein
MILAPGEKLGGFRIREVIGIGGMAVVYRAEQLSLGREVALKVLSPALGEDEAFCERFRREGRNIAALEHPNIIAVYDLGEADGQLFLALRLIRGETLAERIDARGITLEETVSVLGPVAEALDTAHRAGLVHRDVKPQNILIAANARPYLADFGIAKDLTAAGETVDGGFLGTYDYAAPEQILGQRITPAVDVYGLAAVLYQCLTGQPPYRRNADAAVLHAHVYEPPPIVEPDQPGGARLNRLIARGMAKRPDGRFPSACELIREVEELVGGLPMVRRVASPAFTAIRAPADESGVRSAGSRPDAGGGPETPTASSPHAQYAGTPPLSAAGLAASSSPTPPAAELTPLPVRLRPYGRSSFIGRRREHEALAVALSEVDRLGGQAAFVTGEPGIGKTRLVSEFATDAHAAGVVVLAGRCDNGLNVPYQPFVEALEQLIANAPADLLARHIARYGDSVARLVPALAERAEIQSVATEPSESERFQLFRAVDGLLSAACDRGKVLLVLEDLHWASTPTLDLLRRLVTAPHARALMLLGTCRVAELAAEHPLRELLADLHREPRVRRLDLAGLELGDISELVSGFGELRRGAADAQLIRALQDISNGNPFFVTELVSALIETGALLDVDGRWRLVDGVDLAAQMPVSIGETLDRRLARLPSEARRCLAVAAVVGEEFALDLVVEVAGADAAAMRPAAEAGVVIEVASRPQRFRFAHALMQRYLYGQLRSAQQVELHRQIAVAMEHRAGGERRLGELAQHWLEAVDLDLEAALEYSVMAGDEALTKLAPAEAGHWYGEAMDLLERTHRVAGPERCELLLKLGDAERQAGDRRFRGTLLEAAELAGRIGDDDRLVRAALRNTRGMQSETGVVDAARLATLDSALRIVGEGDSLERAQLLALQAAELMYSGDWSRRVRLSDEALAVARRLDDPDALGTVLNMRFVTLLAPETLTERRANAADAVTVAERLDDPLVRFYAYHWLAYACIESGDILAARSWVAREHEIGDRFRQPTTLWLSQADRANLAIVAGDLDLAEELAVSALQIGQHSEPDAAACHAAQQASIAYERHRLSELVPVLERAVHENPGVPGFRATLALALSHAARPDEARALLERALESNFPDVPYDVTWLTVACIYAQTSSALSHIAAASMLYELLLPWSGQVAFPAFGVWGPVSLHLASLAMTRGERDAAERHLLEASQMAIRAGAPTWGERAAAQRGRLDGMAW